MDRVDEKLQDLLAPALRSLGVNGQVRDAQLVDLFAELVGPALSSMCRAERLERDCLVVATSNSALAHQLQLESVALIESINKRLGSTIVRRFRFVPQR